MTPETIALVLSFVAVSISGLKSAAFYSGRGIGPEWVHPAQFVITCALGWIAALVFWEHGLWIAACAGVGVSFLGDVVFQGFINIDNKWPFIDLNEKYNAGSTWNLPLGEWELNMPKFYGWGRVFQIVVGTGALVYLILTVGG